jgi:hypothetical protein
MAVVRKGARMRKTRRLRGSLATTAAVTALAVIGLGPAQAAGQAPGRAAASAAVVSRSATTTAPLTSSINAPCNAAVAKGVARCFAVVATPASRRITADAAGPAPTSLSPADIQSAYNLPAAGGATVAVVDAYGDSSAEADLGVYRAQYGLPPCTTANGCFSKVSQRGGTDYPQDQSDWAMETSLDLDAVSAACPGCHILLVQADDASIGNLGVAEQETVTLGAKFVSNSYGTGEASGEQTADSLYDFPGVVIAAATGDVGNIVSWPAASGNVLAVGGTNLTKDAASARGWDETAWQGGGSGCSIAEPKPSFQQGVATNCANRAEADIAADADPATGLAVYDTLGQNGWLQVGGTSLATPLITAMYAMAGTPLPGSYPASYPYHDLTPGKDLNDITSGSDGSCGNLLCNAGPGWDGPTGVGSPDGLGALSQRPVGDLSGRVTDASTGKPVAGATVRTTAGGYATTTDASGAYDLRVQAGTYDLVVSAYGYADATQSGVTVTKDQTTPQDISLSRLSGATVSGTVTDGSGHGWPLYAKITISGYPGGPVYTNPFTGQYQVALSGPAIYTVHVDPAYPSMLHAAGDGYQPHDLQWSVGTSNMTENVALAVDKSACVAPGYGWSGLSEGFGGGGHAPAGWAVSGWRFDDPADRPPPSGGDEQFAVADSAAAGKRVGGTLTSPAVDLTGQSAPHLSFDSAFYAGPGDSAAVQLSTDDGHSWTTLWQHASADAVGPVDIAIPAARVRVRFSYSGRNGWWAVDNVFAGTRTCVAIPGGMLSGLVTDHGTGTAAAGAVITGTGGESAIATDTGEVVSSALYWLFIPRTGSQDFTATDAGYLPAHATVTITGDQVTRHDWSLTAGGGS